MLNRRQALGAATGLFATGGLASRARAQAIDKLVHIVVGFPAGGGTDIVARVLARGAARHLRVEHHRRGQTRRQRAACGRVREKRAAGRFGDAVHARFSDDALSVELQVAQVRSGQGFHSGRRGGQRLADLRHRPGGARRRDNALGLHRLVQGEPGPRRTSPTPRRAARRTSPASCWRARPTSR